MRPAKEIAGFYCADCPRWLIEFNQPECWMCECNPLSHESGTRLQKFAGNYEAHANQCELRRMVIVEVEKFFSALEQKLGNPTANER